MTDAFVLQRLAADPERLAELVDGLPKETAEAVEPEDTAEPAAADPVELAAATPERVASKPTLTRKEPKVANLLPDERASRMSELENEIKGVSERFTGKLPLEIKVSYEADKKELADLQEDEREYQERKVDLARIGAKPEHRDLPEFNVIKKPENIYDLGEIEARGRSLEERGQMYRDNAMRSAESTHFDHPDTDVPKTQARIQHLLDSVDSPDKEIARRILLTGSPVYKRAFNKLCASGGNTAVLSPEEQRGTALAMSVTTTGGFLVPYAFDPTVIAVGAHTTINPYRKVCRVVDIAGANIWHALTSTAVVATRTTEAATTIESGTTLAQPSYTPSRVQTQVTYSLEVGQDRPNLGEEIAVLIQEAKDNEEESTFAIGVNASATIGVVGIGAPTGTSGCFTAKAEVGGAGAIYLSDLLACEMDLPIRWRMNAAWFMNRVNIRKCQALETSYGQLFNGAGYGSPGYPAVGNPKNDAFGNTGLSMLGYPVYESNSLPIATTTTITLATFCDPQQFVIVDRIGMQVQFIPFTFATSPLVTGQQALYAMWRNAAAPVNVDGGRILRWQ
jgi:Predicted phage phi-C31 gp36 major capsid-like protein